MNHDSGFIFPPDDPRRDGVASRVASQKQIGERRDHAPGPGVVLRPLAGPAAYARTGAVFIHGKGGANLANAGVARAYWGEDMLRASTKNWSCPT